MKLVAVAASALSGCSLYFAPHGSSGARSGSTPDAAPDYASLCDAPQGPGIAMTPSQVPSYLAGRWWRCGGADEFRGDSIELTADQHFYCLTEVDGAFVRNLGPQTSGTYTVVETSGYEFAIDQLWGDGTSPSYSLQGLMTDSPREMHLGGGAYVLMQ